MTIQFNSNNFKICLITVLFILSSLYLGFYSLSDQTLSNYQSENNKNSILSDSKNYSNQKYFVQDEKQINQITIPFSGFIENVGQQGNNDIDYYYNSQSSAIAFLASEVIFSKNNNAPFTITFEGSNTVHPLGIIQSSHLTNFFIGNKKITNVPSFQEVWYHNLYDKIDLRYYNTVKGLKYEFLIYPGGNPANIQLKYSDNVEVQTTPTFVEIAKEQVLFNDTDLVAFTTPLSYNKLNTVNNNDNKTKINLSFENLGDKNLIGFRIGNYDINKLLIIDPLILGFSTLIGGSNADTSRSITGDSMGNVYITGTTSSTNFTGNATSFDNSENGAVDVFVTKIDTSSNKIIYSTYLGGSSNDEGFAIAIDSSGNAYVTGYTSSTNFPVSNNAYSKNNNDNGIYTDTFVTKLNSTGNGLVYSTYLGGSSNDYGYSLVVNANGNLFVLGDTLSSNFPVNSSSFDSSYNGGRDAFIVKFNTTGNGLLYSTFLGGSSDEWSQSIKIDNSDNAYITGRTYSSNYPVNNTAFDSTFNGGFDIFVSKLNSLGTKLLFSTFIGGSGGEQANSIFVDNNQNIYLTGYTTSPNFPVINALYSNYTSGGTSGYDAFVLKLNKTGNNLVFSSYLGGTKDEAGNSIFVDNFGKIFVTGYTYSTDFPVTMNSIQLNNTGGIDAFLSVFTSSGSGLVVSTYLGGSGNDYANSLYVDSFENIFITGQTFSSNFPLASSSFSGSGDAFISKLMFSPDISISNPTNNSYNSHLISLNYLVTDINLDRVNIYIDNVKNTSALPSGSLLNGSFGLTDGIHNLTIEANNTLGLVSVKKVNFTIDTIAPIITIFSPIIKTYGSNHIMLNYSIFGQSFLAVYLDGTKNGSFFTSGNYLPFLSDGDHNITFVARDQAGNYANQTVLFNVDTTAPVLSITSPENLTYSNGSVMLTYSINDFSSYTTFIYIDGEVNSSLNNSGYRYNLTAGIHNITILVTDIAGNSISKTVTFTVETFNSLPPITTTILSFSSSQSKPISSQQSSILNTTTSLGFGYIEIIVFSFILSILHRFKRKIKKKE